jgi:hypothetical protein
MVFPSGEILVNEPLFTETSLLFLILLTNHNVVEYLVLMLTLHIPSQWKVDMKAWLSRKHRH